MSDPRLKRFGLSGFNKPKRTPSHPTKSHVVLAKEGDKVKLIRFGMQGAKQNHQERVNQTQIRQNARVLRLGTQKILPKVKCQQLFGQTGQSGANIVNNCKFFIYGRRSNQA